MGQPGVHSLLPIIATFKLLKGLTLLVLALVFLLFIHPTGPAAPMPARTVPPPTSTPASQPTDEDEIAPTDEPAPIVAPVVGPVRSPARLFERLLSQGLDRARHFSPRTRVAVLIGAFLYSGLYFLEGVGLLLKKRWAEWLVVVMTALFVPLELYELHHKFTLLRLAILVVNLAVLAYLIWLLNRQHHEAHPKAPATGA